MSQPQENRPPDSDPISLASDSVSRPPDQTDDGPGETRTFNSPPASIPVGKTFGRYEIVRQLGEGGMGTVYLARDPQLDRQVALKIPRFTVAGDLEAVERFYREARAMASLRHANLCPIHEVGEVHGTPYLTMDYIEGRTMQDLLRKGQPVAPRQAALAIRLLAQALHEAHRHGIIHRDLKPSNIMIEKGQPVIMDFGLARREQQGEAQLTRDGALLGTPAYMSPEQVNGDVATVGPATDVYSLGVILYELLTCQRPFTGSVTSILVQIMTETAKPPRELRSDIPASLEAICLRAMARQPEERFASAAELARALNEFIKQDKSQAAGTSVAPLAIPVANLSTTSSIPLVIRDMKRRPAPNPKSQRQRAMLLWGSAVTLVGVMIIGWFLSGIISRVKTPPGTIVVEIDQPELIGATVSVDGEQKLTITVDGASDPIEVTADAKLHTLRVTKGGFETFTQQFTLQAGRQRTIRVRLEPTAALPSAVAQATDPHRRAAEWVIGYGGSVEVFTAQGSKRATKSADLPSEPFVLIHAGIYNRPDIPKGEWKQLADVPTLRILTAENCGLDDSVLVDTISRITTLTSLDIDANSALTDTGIKRLAALTRLRQLEMSGSQITANGLRQLADLKRLDWLSIGSCPLIRDDALPHLANFPRLETLYINKTGITESGLLELPVLPRLNKLFAGGNKYSKAALARLLEFPELQNAYLEDTGADAAAIQQFAGHTSLSCLGISDGPDIDAATLPGLQAKLPRCVLFHPTATAPDSEREALQWLLNAGGAADCYVGTNLGYFDTIPVEPAYRIHTIHLGRSVSADAFERLRSLSGLAGLLLDGDWIGDEHLRIALTNLPVSAPFKSLSVQRSTITDASLGLVAARRQLKDVNVNMCRSLTDKGMESLGLLSRLKSLSMSGTGATDDTLRSYAALRELSSLYLYNQPKITDAGLSATDCWPELQYLYLGSISITDHAIPQIIGCRELTELHVGGTHITAAGIETLQRALPACVIYWDGGVILPGTLPPTNATSSAPVNQPAPADPPAPAPDR